MSLLPNAPVDPSPPRVARSFAAGTSERARQTVSRGAILRRRVMVVTTKLVLPLIALALLTLIAIWPELDRATRQAQVAFRRVAGVVDGAAMNNARYRGTDERGRPYTMTADVARQTSQNRIDLVEPKGDLSTESGGWLLVEAREGVFLQRDNQLDLARDVFLYRDDGMTMRTQAMAIDMKSGAAASNVAVHIEGPMGVLDAPGFVLMEKGAVIQFPGPARMVMNGTQR